MEIRIEDTRQIAVNGIIDYLNQLREVLPITDVRIEPWVDVWRSGDKTVEWFCPTVTFDLPELDDHAMRVLTTAFEGTGFEFYAPEIGLRWTIA